MSNAFEALQLVLRAVGDSLVPQHCFVCGGRSRARPVCDSCRRELPSLSASCPLCAIPTLDAATCGRCLRAPPAFDATRAAFVYGFPVDRLVQALKYRHKLALAGFFADALRPLFASPGALLLPMPLHRRRLRERGFNQAVEIARPLSRACAAPVELDAVSRVLDTAPQVSLPWTARSVNMRGAFRCDASFAGRTVVVVDDVMTTGATLDELARTLKRYGAARVENLVVARTPSPD